MVERALNHLPNATVQAHVEFQLHKPAGDAGNETAAVTLTNTTDTLAFFIEMKIAGKKSQRALTPVFWDDNYISLPPHAGKVLHARFPGSERPELKLQGWNVTFENTTSDH
jgi:exo-1,4-beta-D-glucosaminidase